MRQSALLRTPGVTHRVLERAVADGAVERIARGIYAVAGRDRLSEIAASARGRLTCASGAAALGLWVLREPPLPHVACHRSAPRGGRELVVHRAIGDGCSLPWVARPLEIVLHALRCLPELEALTIVESALRLTSLEREDLERCLRGQRDGAARAVLARANPQSQSILETVGRFDLENVGVDVEVQHHVRGYGHADLWARGTPGVLVECHGVKYHNNATQFREDLRRANVATISGIPLLQYPGDTLLWHRDEMVSDVLRLLGEQRRT